MGYEDQVGVDDLSLIYPQLAGVVRKILSSDENCNLSEIENFDNIAIEINIQVYEFIFLIIIKFDLID